MELILAVIVLLKAFFIINFNLDEKL